MRLFIFLISCICLSNICVAQNSNISEEEDFNGEPFLAMDPQNPQHLVAAWMGFNGLNFIQIHERTSFDGGETWTEPYLFPHLPGHNTSADPSIAFSDDGKVFICLIDYNLDGSTGGVYVYKSDDGGITFHDPVEAIHTDDDPGEYPVDRPWMVIDKSEGVNNGNIYITTKPAPWEPIPNRNYFVVSTNGGETFTDWKYIDAPGWSIGNFIAAPMATPAVSSDGVFYTIYPSYEITESFYPRFICAKSENAGETFTYSLVKTETEPNNDTILKFGYLLITDELNPPHLSFLNVLSTFGDADILVNESYDGGETWSATMRVNDDAINNSVDQDLVWADYDDNGNLLVSWRDRRNADDTGSLAGFEIYAAVKWKDSISFSPNFRISDLFIDFDDVFKENGNDFMSCIFNEDTIYAIWGDTRDGNLDIWFTKINARNDTATFIQNINKNEDRTLLIPNPAHMGQIVYIQLNVDFIQSISLFDMKGEKVFTKNFIENELPQFQVPQCEPGTYFYTIEAKENYKSGTIIFIK